MPELPEVEATRRALQAEIRGRSIVAAVAHHPRVLRRQDRPADFADRMKGRTVRRLGRHGKFLLIELEGDLTWVTHLGMSGRIQVAGPGADSSIHTRVTVAFDDSRELRFVDPRTFGFMAVWTAEELDVSTVARLGPDAFAELPDRRRLSASLDGRTAMIKPLLLDQGIVAGVGNIYADESLHRARVAPTRPGGSLSLEEVGRLRRGIRDTLRAAVERGGTSLDDLAYLLPDGRAGEFLPRLRVYGREGGRCRRCGGEIRRVVLRGRSAFWCPGCQT